MDNQTIKSSPKMLTNTGKEFFEAFKILYDKYPDEAPLPNLRLYKVKLYLVGQSIELLFKSILLNYGISLNELKNKYGHDLNKALQKVIEIGILPINETDIARIKLLNTLYFTKDLQYPVRGTKQLPWASELRSMTENLYNVHFAQLDLEKLGARFPKLKD